MEETLSGFIDKELSITADAPCIFFLGAGASFNSGVPTVKPLLEEFMSHLPLAPEDCEKYFSKQFPFESFINSIKKLVDIDRMLSVFDATNPNLNHHLIACLAKQGLVKKVFTTNFDNLLESALDKEQVPYKKFVPTATYKPLKSKKKGVHILKLHGSIEHRDELGITIQQIARRENISQIEKVFKDIFSYHPDSSIVYLGYSFSDHFDITPLIRKYRDLINNKIVIVEHMNTCGLFNIADKEALKINNPFYPYEKVHKIICHTDEFVKCLWEKYIGSILPPVAEKALAVNWTEKMAAFSADQLSSDSIKLVLAGRIMTIASFYKDAIKYYSKALENSLPDIKLSANIHSYLAQINYITTNDYAESIRLYKKAIRLRKDIPDYKGISNDLAEIGVCKRMQKKYKLSLAFQRKSIRVSRKIKFREGIYTSLTSMGNIYFELGKYRRAISYHKKARRSAHKAGDRKNEAFVLVNMGGAYIKLEKFSKAFRFLKKGYALAEQFMHYRLMATACFDLFKLLQLQKKDPESASVYFEEARKYAGLANDSFILEQIKKYSPS